MSSSPALTALKKATEALRDQYVKANPKSAEAYENAKISGVAGGTNRASIFYSPFPLTFVNANEATAITADGQHLTDFLGNFTAGLFGFSPTPVKEAVAKAMDNGHALGGAPNLMEARVAKAFTSRYASMDLVRFSNTGTEANSYAIHTARAVSGKNKIMMYDGAYHGAWIHGGKMAGPLDTPYEKIIVPYGDADLICNAIRENADDLAAFIMEPVMVNPMVYLKTVAPAKYLQAIQEACTESNCALIFDEVMTGFRLGLTGAQGHFGITPDMSCFGKVIGGGLPVGAFGGRAEIMDWLAPDGPVYQAGTLSGNPLAMAAGVAVLEALADGSVYEKIEALGQALSDGLAKAAAAAGVSVQLQRIGSMSCCYFADAPVYNMTNAMQSDRDRFAKYFQGMLEEGVYIAPSQFEAGFISAAHDEAAIEKTVAAASKVMETI